MFKVLLFCMSLVSKLSRRRYFLLTWLGFKFTCIGLILFYNLVSIQMLIYFIQTNIKHNPILPSSYTFLQPYITIRYFFLNPSSVGYFIFSMLGEGRGGQKYTISKSGLSLLTIWQKIAFWKHRFLNLWW